MATDKTTAEGILSQLSAVADARMRPMFGEYVVYVDEKVIGQINESRLFIKRTKFGEAFASESELLAFGRRTLTGRGSQKPVAAMEKGVLSEACSLCHVEWQARTARVPIFS